MVGEILTELFRVYLANLENLHFANYTQNYSAHILTTMNPSEAVLYPKRTGGYPLSSHIKIITVASV